MIETQKRSFHPVRDYASGEAHKTQREYWQWLEDESDKLLAKWGEPNERPNPILFFYAEKKLLLEQERKLHAQTKRQLEHYKARCNLIAQAVVTA